jgi:ribonuclease Z
MRRAIFALTILWLGFWVTDTIAAEADFRVTLLGTSSPSPLPDRFGPSTLIEAGGQKLIIDAGRGVPIRLAQLRIPLSKIDVLFLTHYHSDHVSGIPDFWLTRWLRQPVPPFHVIGPVGAKELMANLERAYAADIKIREEDEKLPPEGVTTVVDEFANDGVVYEKEGVRVTMFAVNHGDAIKPAVGYLIDYSGKAVVISGDTRFNENVIKYGTGVDLLIHEVCTAKPELLALPRFQSIIAHHTTPHEAGMVFDRAHPKLAVYTHIVRLTNDTIAAPTVPDIAAETRQTYKGPLVIGEDLMTFDIGDGEVAVYRSAP